MKTKEIPLSEYKALWEDMKSRMSFTSPNLDPRFKRMTVAGLSGKGMRFENEYDRLSYAHFNPVMPSTIRMIGEDGEEVIVPTK